MKIYVVGAPEKKFFKFDESREKYLINDKHEGENIDNWNSRYCELTGLYYLWKHCDDDILGLEHYRRSFKYNGHLLNAQDAESILNDNDVICHKAILRSYRLGRQLQSFIGKNDYHKIMVALKTTYPDYYETALKILDYKWHIQFNMLIAKKEFVNNYCEWLFGLLNPLVEFTGVEVFRKRSIGYISEILLNTLYFVHNNIKYKECEVELLDGYKGKGFSKFGTPLNFNIRK